MLRGSFRLVHFRQEKLQERRMESRHSQSDSREDAIHGSITGSRQARLGSIRAS
jgi:hypothetical protein